MFDLIPWRRKEATMSRGGGGPLVRWRDEFESLLDRFFGRWPVPEDGAQMGWGLDLEDADKEFIVRAEAPRFEADDFDIQVQDNMLTNRAERKQETGKKKDEAYSYSEQRLQRSVTLPGGIDADKIEASYRNGILELHMPKLPQAQGKRIEVKKS